MSLIIDLFSPYIWLAAWPPFCSLGGNLRACLVTSPQENIYIYVKNNSNNVPFAPSLLNGLSKACQFVSLKFLTDNLSHKKVKNKILFPLFPSCYWLSENAI